MAAIGNGKEEDGGLDWRMEEKKEEEEEEEQPQSFSQIMRKWPRVTFFIVGNEFCERFSYYGMRSILTIYLIKFLGYGDRTATTLFHTFAMIAYFTPLLGSILADGFIGKFWTILSLSIVYAAGQITLSIASTLDADNSLHPHLDFLGLLVIAIGTGGIKPCVSAFGGDQFNPSYTKMISMFFSVFYFSINAGSTISMFLTPVFRDMECMGRESCFPLAFGVPAALMILATIFFIAGSLWYKRNPPAENIISRVVRTIYAAIKNKLSGKTKREHWLDHALDEHECERSERCKEGKGECEKEPFIRDVKSLVRVLVMLASFPMFWALYDQQGSRWTIQAMSMNPHIVAGIYLLPDQMQVLNAILILIFIPLFQMVVYPLVEKCGIKTTSLRRMTAGGILAAVAFVICACVQLAIEGTQVPAVIPGNAHVTFVNANPSCLFKMVNPSFPDKIAASETSVNDRDDRFDVAVGSPSWHIRGEGNDCPVNSPISLPINESSTYSVLLLPKGYALTRPPTKRTPNGHRFFGLSVLLDLPCSSILQSFPTANCTDVYRGTLNLCRADKECDPNDEESFVEVQYDDRTTSLYDVIPYDGSTPDRKIIAYPCVDVSPGKYNLYIADQNTRKKVDGFDVDVSEVGGVYSTVASERAPSSLHCSVPSSISILWQIPQYIVITAAEILFSITGLEFAYSEAAPSLKSVVQALYLLTVAFGDFIIIAVNGLNLFSSLVTEMLVFAAAMLIVMVIFTLLSVFYYEYAHYDEESKKSKKK